MTKKSSANPHLQAYYSIGTIKKIILSYSKLHFFLKKYFAEWEKSSNFAIDFKGREIQFEMMAL